MLCSYVLGPNSPSPRQAVGFMTGQKFQKTGPRTTKTSCCAYVPKANFTQVYPMAHDFVLVSGCAFSVLLSCCTFSVMGHVVPSLYIAFSNLHQIQGLHLTLKCSRNSRLHLILKCSKNSVTFYEKKR